MGKIVKATRENIELAARLIKSGGVVIYPTDTVYGVGCDPFNVTAVRRLIEDVKSRERKPLPVLACSLKHAEKIAHLTDNAIKLANKFWPGPLTIVLKKKKSLPDIVTQGKDSVGIRIPDHDVALKLTELSGGLLIGTSANISGKPPAKTVEEAYMQIGDRVDLLLNGGKCAIGVSSTVVDLTHTKPVIIREGPLNRDLIALALRDRYL